MGLKDLGPDSPGIIATQSTHKQLASFFAGLADPCEGPPSSAARRAASSIAASTSSSCCTPRPRPFYPLFASLDVGAQMMKGRSGEVLWDDTIRLGIELRKKMRGRAREFEATGADPARRWFFDPFVPRPSAIRWPRRRGTTSPGRRSPTDVLAADPRCGNSRPGAAWHGFRHVAPGFAITDPNKLTLLTPGFDRTTGAYAEHGIPAPVVAQYLRENRIVLREERPQFAAVPADARRRERARPARCSSHLVAFKKLHDDNAPLDEVIPDFVARRPARYARDAAARPVRRDACASIARPARRRCKRAQFRAEHLPEIAMAPHDAVRALARNTVDYLPLDEIDGRIATTLLVVYPPGIATIVPGERLGARARPMIDYLRAFETAANAFPGFESEVQGLHRETAGGWHRALLYLRRAGVACGEQPRSNAMPNLPDGTPIPALGQGTWHMGEDARARRAEADALRLGLDLGMTLIDTAEMYGEGGAGEGGGRCRRGAARRGVPRLQGLSAQCLAPRRGRRLRAQPEADARRDHRPLSAALARIGAAGRDGRGLRGAEDAPARSATGACPTATWTTLRNSAAALADCATDQVLYSLEHRGIEFDLLPFCARRRMPVMAYSPVGQGGRMLRHPALAEVAARHGATPAQVAIAWTLRGGNVVSIPKAADPAHVRLNAAAREVVLTADDLATLDAGFPPPTRKRGLAML